jgi:hypothetical protein
MNNGELTIFLVAEDGVEPPTCPVNRTEIPWQKDDKISGEYIG